MGAQFQSSTGKTYFVRQSLTKTGKVRYVCTATASDNDLEALPEGMEFHESATGIVSVRKKLVSKITDKEYQYVLKTASHLVKRRGIKVELKKTSMIIYECATPELPPMLELLLAGKSRAKLPSVLVTPLATPVFRLTLVDEEERVFVIERRCYLGAEESWMYLEKGDLKTLITRYAPHIGKDSFFKLF